ncbi:putative protein SPEAR2 [Cocos nucifera]|nr:putative protein SPEAR2 [Cocos nucifera]
MVLQEEQPKCSNGGNGGGKKKNKQKKIPQRGLGVAQLEKLRIEERQKNHAHSSSNASQGMIPFPSQQPILPFLTATNDPNPVLRPVVNHDPVFRHLESISIPTNRFETTLPQLLENSVVDSGNAGHGFLSMLWNSMDPSPINPVALARNFDFCTPLNGDSSIPGWPSSGLLQRRQRRQLSPISVVTKVWPPSSSGVSLQMEPPSNQSYTSSCNVSSSWPEEERGSMSDVISSSQPPVHSFLPMGPNSCEKTLNEQRREALDGVDLNLKL